MPLKREKVPPEGGTGPVGVKLSDKNAAAEGEKTLGLQTQGNWFPSPPPPSLSLFHTH